MTLSQLLRLDCPRPAVLQGLLSWLVKEGFKVSSDTVTVKWYGRSHGTDLDICQIAGPVFREPESGSDACHRANAETPGRIQQVEHSILESSTPQSAQYSLIKEYTEYTLNYSGIPNLI